MQNDADTSNINEIESECEVNNLKNKVIELEYALKVKERKIKFLESKLANKTSKFIPCQTSQTQVSFQNCILQNGPTSSARSATLRDTS